MVRGTWYGMIRTIGAGIVAACGLMVLFSTWPEAETPLDLRSTDALTVTLNGEWEPIDPELLARLEWFPSHVMGRPSREEDPVPEEAVEEPFVEETPASTPRPISSTYTVSKNDSYWRIAERELGDGIRHGQILDWNPHLQGKTLQPGMTLILYREGISAEGVGSRLDRPHSESATQVYLVKRGDTLTAIARSYGVSSETLFQENRDRVSSPDLIPVGTHLRVPASPRGFQ